jgi:hypothetical protein
MQNYATFDAKKQRFFVMLNGEPYYFPVRQPKTLAFELKEDDSNDPYAKLYRDEVVLVIENLALPRYGLANYVVPSAEKKATPQEKRILDNLNRAGKRLLGFHSVVEKECLRILLRGSQPLIICPARSLENLRLPEDWKEPLAQGRLLLLSRFGTTDRRVTAELAARRNEFIAAMADEVWFAHIAPGGKMQRLANKVRGTFFSVKVDGAQKSGIYHATSST